MSDQSTRPVTRSLDVAAVGGRVQLCQSAIMPGDEYFTSAVILTAEIARSLAAALVEMADVANTQAAEAADRATEVVAS